MADYLIENKQVYIRELLHQIDIVYINIKYRLLHKFYDEVLVAILDIDNTALINDTWMDSYFGYDSNVSNIKNYHHAIPPVLKLYYYLLKNNIKIYFITARPYSEANYKHTRDNLMKVGYTKFEDIFMFGDQRIYETSFERKIPDKQLVYCVTMRNKEVLNNYKMNMAKCSRLEAKTTDDMYRIRLCKLNNHVETISQYKSNVRQCISEKLRYSIIINIGDQDVDLVHGLSEYAIRLPTYNKNPISWPNYYGKHNVTPTENEYNLNKYRCLSKYQQLEPMTLRQCLTNAKDLAESKQ